jgi:hypothetical protein
LDIPFPKWTVWDRVQPNNGAGGPVENCIALEYDLGYTFQVWFNDRACGDKGVKFICEVRTYKKMCNFIAKILYIHYKVHITIHWHISF